MVNTIALRQIVTADARHTIHVKLPPEIFDRVEVVVMFAANDQSEIPEESLTWIATGLPLAAHFANGFGKQYPVTGFDIKQGRIDELKAGRDSTCEVEPAELAEAKHLSFTADPEQLRA